MLSTMGKIFCKKCRLSGDCVDVSFPFLCTDYSSDRRDSARQLLQDRILTYIQTYVVSLEVLNSLQLLYLSAHEDAGKVGL